uniref:Uncharacterized protein n=1 Tax=Anopheles coluzzii TaxID=1518534 RepID=A0A8W7PW86_ANOCL
MSDVNLSRLVQTRHDKVSRDLESLVDSVACRQPNVSHYRFVARAPNAAWREGARSLRNKASQGSTSQGSEGERHHYSVVEREQNVRRMTLNIAQQYEIELDMSTLWRPHIAATNCVPLATCLAVSTRNCFMGVSSYNNP